MENCLYVIISLRIFDFHSMVEIWKQFLWFRDTCMCRHLFKWWFSVFWMPPKCIKYYPLYDITVIMKNPIIIILKHANEFCIYMGM